MDQLIQVHCTPYTFQGALDFSDLSKVFVNLKVVVIYQKLFFNLKVVQQSAPLATSPMPQTSKY